jgi:hypothetical protein
MVVNKVPFPVYFSDEEDRGLACLWRVLLGEAILVALYFGEVGVIGTCVCADLLGEIGLRVWGRGEGVVLGV